MDSSQLVSYSEWIRKDEAPRKSLAECEAKEIGCFLAKSIVIECFNDPPTSDLVIFVPTQGIVREDVVLDHGFGRFASRPRTGNFVISTPGIASEAKGVGPFEMLSVSLPWPLISRSIQWLTGEELVHLPPALHSNGWHDDYTHQLLAKLWNAVQLLSSNERLVLDELIIQISERLLWLGGVNLPQAKFDAVLARQKLADVTDYVGESFSSPLSLEELSQVAGCSQYHFSRLFKASTGYSPMEYVIRCRIDRVREALWRDADRSLVSIAAECGFSDQSHMGRHFKRIVGITPRKWQEKNRGKARSFYSCM